MKGEETEVRSRRPEDGRPSEIKEATMVRKTEERQNHDSVSDDSAQVAMLELVLLALRQICKTNPNDGRDQNRKRWFFYGKMNISDWRGPGERTCFYETNPNRES